MANRRNVPDPGPDGACEAKRLSPLPIAYAGLSG